jgi:hypothetical protein
MAGTRRICEMCGGVGDTCCAGRTCTAASTICAGGGAGTCDACGGSGQPCCPGLNDAGMNVRICNSGRACMGGGVGTCPVVPDASAD